MAAVGLLLLVAPAATADPSPVAAAAPPWLGVRIQNHVNGVEVVEVIDGAPAAAAGLREGDVILAIDQQRCADTRALIALVGRYRVGDRVEVAVRRRDRTLRLPAVLGQRLSEDEVRARRLLDKPAPAFALEMLRGDLSGRLEGLRGNVVLLEFWATWCKACRSTHEQLSRFARDSREQGVVVLGISRETRSTLVSFLNGQGAALDFEIARDPDGSVFGDYMATSVPLMVVIDRSGIVRYAGVGAGANVENAVWAAKRAMRAKR